LLPESRNFFKSLFKLVTFQPLSENSQINFLPPKTLKLYFFYQTANFICAWLLRDLVYSLHQRVIGDAVDHVAWTAARLCEN